MFKKLLVLLFISMVLVVNCVGPITIKSITTTPSTDPTAIDNGSGINTCSGIVVSVEFSADPGTSTIAASLASNQGDIIDVKKDAVKANTWVISGISLAEGTALSNFKISIDGTEVALNQDVSAPTIKCLSSTASSAASSDDASDSSASSASSSAASSDSASSDDSGSSDSGVISSSNAETSDAPKVQTFKLVTSKLATATVNEGHLFCKDVKIDFTLDKIVSTDILVPTYHSRPATGKSSTHLPDQSVPNYYFLLDVAVGGNLKDLKITYNSEFEIDHPEIEFSCITATDDQNDGSFASTISINSLFVICLTTIISSILLLQQF